MPEQDPFRPELQASVALNVSSEQRALVRQVLALCASDSRFAQKGAEAIEFILTSGPAPKSPDAVLGEKLIAHLAKKEKEESVLDKMRKDN